MVMPLICRIPTRRRIRLCCSSLAWTTLPQAHERLLARTSSRTSFASLSPFVFNATFAKLNHSIYLYTHTHVQYPFSSNANTYTNDGAQAYNRTIKSILSSKKFVGIFNALKTQGIWDEDMQLLFQDWMLTKDPIVDSNDTDRILCRLQDMWIQNQDNDTLRSMLLSVMELQQEAFTDDLTNAYAPNRNNGSFQLPQSFLNTAQQLFRQMAEEGRNTSSQLSIIIFAWKKIKESGVVLCTSTLNALLNAATRSLKDTNNLYLANSKEGLLVAQEIIMYHDILCDPTDKADSMIAEAEVKTFKNTTKYKRNTREMIYLQIYEQILKYRCSIFSCDIGGVLSLLRKMQSLSGVVLEPWVYILVLSTIAEKGYFRNDSQLIEGVLAIGYQHACGPQLFDEMADQLAAEAVEITPEGAEQLQRGLKLGFKDGDTPIYMDSFIRASPAEGGQLPTKHDELVARRVTLDPTTWTCNVTRTQHHIVSMSRDQLNTLCDDILESADEGTSKKLHIFLSWLESRRGPPFTAIVDGANVGAIASVVKSLEEKGEHPLVIVPMKLFRQRTYLVRLENQGQLYIAPSGLDDIFCVMATVSKQTAPPAASTHWTGARRSPILITNDTLRDHTLQLKNPLLARQWYNSHVVNLIRERQDLTNTGPQFYQRGIQGHSCPVISKDGYEWGGTAWLFPVEGGSPYDRLVVRIPTRTKGPSSG